MNSGKSLESPIMEIHYSKDNTRLRSYLHSFQNTLPNLNPTGRCEPKSQAFLSTMADTKSLCPPSCWNFWTQALRRSCSLSVLQLSGWRGISSKRVLTLQRNWDVARCY